MTIFIWKRYFSHSLSPSQVTGCKWMFGLCVCVQCADPTTFAVAAKSRGARRGIKRENCFLCYDRIVGFYWKYYNISFYVCCFEISVPFLVGWDISWATKLRDSRNDETNVSICSAFRCTTILSAKAHHTFYRKKFSIPEKRRRRNSDKKGIALKIVRDQRWINLVKFKLH